MEKQILKPLLIFSVLGMLTTLGVCIKQPLDGDTSGIGIAALAQPVDPLLLHLSFPIMDPYTFEDMIPGMILQWITGYSPMVIKLLGYLEYLLIIVSCTGLVYWITRDTTKTVLCGALISLLSIGSQVFLSLTLYHNITLALAIVYTVWAYDVDKKPVNSGYVATIASVFILYSDDMFLALFTIPFTVYLIARSFKNKCYPEFNSIYIIISQSILALTTFCFKSGIGSVPKGLSITHACDMTGILFNSAQNVLGMLTSFFDVGSSNPVFTLGLLLAWIIALFIIIIKLDFLDSVFEPRFRYAVFMMGVASTIFIICNLVFVAFWAPRFLIYAVFLGIVLVCCGYNKKSRLQTGAIMVLLAVGLIFNLSCMIVTPNNPNHGDYELINFLDAHNLTYGYSDFRTANTVTYLSKGAVHVLICDYSNNTIYFQRDHCETNWYKNGAAFVIYDNNAYNDSRLKEKPVSADEVYTCGDFTIYYWENPSVQ